MMYETLHNLRLSVPVSDDAMLLVPSTAGSEFDGCLLDAFCEDEGFAFAKLEEIEWRSIQVARTMQVDGLQHAN